jgi:ABC-2 type transport system ATP-binding protein
VSGVPQVVLESLSKTYRVTEREAGIAASLRSLVNRRYRDVHAVRDVTFSVAPGEIVGFLGPNGAGKTTTLKMLAGLLHPSSGDARVLGHVPWRKEREFLRRIGMVMGNRNQLVWDIPAADSFAVNQAIYDIPPAQFRQTLDELVELLALEPLLHKPVRGLSLGERMKCELAVSLLHRPQVLFLDEPTLGVDVTMQSRIRAFVAEHNKRHGATVLLTSHYMADVTALCKRVVVIHHGQLLYDGLLDGLAARFAPFKLVRLDVESPDAAEAAARYGDLVERQDSKVTLRVPRHGASGVVARLLSDLPVVDLTVEEPPIEDVIHQVFETGGALESPRA